MSIYDALRDKLQRSKLTSLRMSFAEVEEAIGRPLPRSAYNRKEWWSNEDSASTRHIQCRSWQSAGYDAEVSITAQSVTFERKNSR
jgi:hypothetical protein